MKRLTKVLLVLGFTAAGVVGTALGGGPLGSVLTFDENGNMTINGNPAPPGIIAPDPLNGNLPALCYQLPFPGNFGDVNLFATNEPASTQFPVSDVIRFEGNFRMYFYSLIDDAEVPDLADVPLLPAPLNPNIAIPEVGAEGQNGALWVPGIGGIGGNPSDPQLQYNFISDAPEPGSALLLLGGFGILGFSQMRRKFRS